MSLLEILLAGPETQDRAPGSCRVANILKKYSGEEREALEMVLEKGSAWPSIRLAKVLSSSEGPISDNTINRHRNGQCSCGR